MLCIWPRSARSSSSCRAAAVGVGEGGSGCGVSVGLLRVAQRGGMLQLLLGLGSTGDHPSTPTELPFPHKQRWTGMLIAGTTPRGR